MLLRSTVVAAAAVVLVWGANTTLPPNEEAALRDFYYAMDGPNWDRTYAATWNDNATDPCTWYGVNCDKDANDVMHVTTLYVEGVGLKGAFPIEALRKLPQLKGMDFSSEQISGPLPDDLSSLTEVTSLYLEFCLFTGPLPVMPPKLQNLQLYSNGFTGTLDVLGSLQDLDYAYVDGNQFTGTLDFLTGMPKVRTIGVANNLLEGAIPTLPDSLTSLNVSANRLTGGLDAVAAATNVETFNGARNCFDTTGANDWCSARQKCVIQPQGSACGVPVPSPTPAPQTNPGGGGNGGVVAGVVVSLIVVGGGFGGYFAYRRWYKRRKELKEAENMFTSYARVEDANDVKEPLAAAPYSDL